MRLSFQNVQPRHHVSGSMKILHIMTDRRAVDGRSAELFLNLQKAGLEQSFVLPELTMLGTVLERANLKTVSHVLSKRFRFLRKLALALLIRREKPDVIQVWDRGAAELISVDRSLPVLACLNAYDDLRFYVSCTDFVGSTQGIVRHIVRSGVLQSHVFRIPSLTNTLSQPPVDRACLATPKDARVLLSLSQLHPAKGLDIVLKTLTVMTGCYAWLEGDGPARRELEMLARKLGVMERVRFLGQRADRAALLRSADICVVPSRHDPFGTAILEAWAAGVPVVGCQNEDSAALAEDGLNALLVPVDDAEKLGVAIHRVLTDEPLRQRLIAQGYAAYIKGYTLEAITRKWLTVYEGLTG